MDQMVEPTIILWNVTKSFWFQCLSGSNGTCDSLQTQRPNRILHLLGGGTKKETRPATKVFSAANCSFFAVDLARFNALHLPKKLNDWNLHMEDHRMEKGDFHNFFRFRNLVLKFGILTWRRRLRIAFHQLMSTPTRVTARKNSCRHHWALRSWSGCRNLQFWRAVTSKLEKLSRDARLSLDYTTWSGGVANLNKKHRRYSLPK